MICMARTGKKSGKPLISWHLNHAQNAMINSRNSSTEPKQIKPSAEKTYRRSPYREPTHVIRVPESLLPRVRKLLDECRQEIKDGAWLEQ